MGKGVGYNFPSGRILTHGVGWTDMARGMGRVSQLTVGDEGGRKRRTTREIGTGMGTGMGEERF